MTAINTGPIDQAIAAVAQQAADEARATLRAELVTLVLPLLNDLKRQAEMNAPISPAILRQAEAILARLTDGSA